VVETLLKALSSSGPGVDGPALRFAVVNSTECVTGRHLFERTVDKVADAVEMTNPARRCETLSQLTVELAKMLKDAGHFVLVFDAIDRQREAPSTLVPAVARLSELVCHPLLRPPQQLLIRRAKIPNLSTVLIVTAPPPAFLRTSFVPHVNFPNYTKAEFTRILSATPPATLATTTDAETVELWTRFTGAVHDAFVRSAARDLPTFRQACVTLWPRFTAPILSGTHSPRDFSKLLIAARTAFQDESTLDPSVIAHPVPSTKPQSAGTDLSALLPATARLLLLAAYLSSHNAPKHDLTLFSTFYHGRKRRGGGAAAVGRGRRPKHRKIARKLLGAHAFPLERMLAAYAAVRSEWAGSDASAAVHLDGDVGVAIATLASLRLLLRVGGGGDLMDRAGKWRANVGWEVVRGLGRSMGMEVEEWLLD
jgi:origin recognition complex subunit 5